MELLILSPYEENPRFIPSNHWQPFLPPSQITRLYSRGSGYSEELKTQTGQRSKVFAPIGVQEDAGIRMTPPDYSTAVELLDITNPTRSFIRGKNTQEDAQRLPRSHAYNIGPPFTIAIYTRG